MSSIVRQSGDSEAAVSGAPARKRRVEEIREMLAYQLRLLRIPDAEIGEILGMHRVTVNRLIRDIEPQTRRFVERLREHSVIAYMDHARRAADDEARGVATSPRLT